jgi:hypothetical protein
MAGYNDLEIGLLQYNDDTYAVDLRFTPWKSEADIRGGAKRVRFDFDRLEQLETDPDGYGRCLSDSLFGDPDVGEAFARAQSYQQAQEDEDEQVGLRVRLYIGPSASELHGLRWETLREPSRDTWLLTSERILFSRYVDSQDWRGVSRLRRDKLRALVVIANPAGLGDDQPGGWKLAPLQVEEERSRAEAGLTGMAITWLDSRGSATLEKMLEHLRDGYDVLYLVCHGALLKHKPRLWLENDAGDVDVVAGGELVARLRDLRRLPQLVVLASCQSAGTGADARSGDGGALAALGPRLGEIGVPAVLAMQGNVSMAMLAAFMPVFFRELQRDGQIDRAMAAARGAVHDHLDSWMPVLFMRLRSGRLWYAPGFGRRKNETWMKLREPILRGGCTPILGPGITESLLGTHRDIARNWADHYGFPMAPHDSEVLPLVAQYLAVDRGSRFPRERLLEFLLAAAGRDDRAFSDDVLGAPLEHLVACVEKHLAASGAERRARDPAEPHAVLARLPFPIYITTNPDNLMADALVAEGKDPQVEICRWHDRPGMRWPASIFRGKQGRSYNPSKERPLVYHLFGRLDSSYANSVDSLVITEDDYFDYLIGTSKGDAIPSVVDSAMVNRPLLFLGFRLDDWNFRVLFRSIQSLQGSALLNNYIHVAVQIDPEEGRILEPEGAKEYLEKFSPNTQINIFWGSAEDFVRELAPWVNDAENPALLGRQGARR